MVPKMVRWGLPVLLLMLLASVYWGTAPAVKTTEAAKREFTDSTGRRVQIPARPQRVIALNASNLDLYYAAGGKVSGRPTTVALSADLLDKIKAIPQVGETSSPNLEKIVALKPDLVLGVDAPFHHALAPVLEKAGIPILLQALPNYQSILQTIHQYGELTGNGEQASRSVAEIEAAVSRGKAKIAGKKTARALVIWGSPESFNMAMPQSFAGNLLTLLGAENVAQLSGSAAGPMPYMPLSLEFIAKADPDVILLITHGADERVSEKFRKDLADHPAWQGMRAVKNSRVHKLPYPLFAVNPGTQVGVAVELLVGLLYPEAKQ